MKTMNKVQLVGYAGADPLVSLCADGSKKVRFNLATHYAVTDPAGEKKYRTVWHRVVGFDAVALRIEQNLLKGSHVLLEGFLRYRWYTDQQGCKRQLTDIKITTITNLDR